MSMYLTMVYILIMLGIFVNIILDNICLERVNVEEETLPLSELYIFLYIILPQFG
jgi:hypothetical protein